ncbi:MBL fold metallo-hydrolase [Vibrio vulnificus]|uniref:MBL fold metallo-hydrolase n=1 Tax=Vibrio vulnificus TaxID=672 RepID=UPI002878A699|nr:MBL fold metallo-hydrolase [Vibrio vulnificus]MDS1861036.1 MBL fold metallo-hydrolase [Vibrio vulnificus]
MQVIHHGGKDTVTGSCHELQLSNRSLLIDCGILQGSETSPLSNQTFDFDLTKLIGLAITHAHIDHIGKLPWLLSAGFSQPVFCTPATGALIPLMLEDGLKLQFGFNATQRRRVLNQLIRLIHPIPFGEWYCLDEATFLRFQPAGHILGSAYIEIKLPNHEVVVFSGDLGQYDTPLLPDPTSPEKADYLFIETTYGNKVHESTQDRTNQLSQIINHALKDGGTILIPAFSIGRTQELLFDIEQLIHQNYIETNIPIILDSPLAVEITKTYRRFKKLWGKEAKQRLEHKRHPLAFDQCVTIDKHQQHLELVNRLSASSEAAIVVAASGMCEGGRIVNYLKAMLPDKRNDLVFAGYQAQNTLGRALSSGAKLVEIDGHLIEVNAEIHCISGYSAHAGQDDLLRFISGIKDQPKEIHLIHGEQHAKQAFARILRQRNYHVIE